MNREGHAFQSKGLSNPRGANNCWLNSAVQLLWHIDVFRQSINRISGHYRCLQEYCVYCHVKALLSDYEYNSELSIPPDALRNALATSCSKSFKMGNLGDPIEAYQAVLDRLHEQLVKDEPDGQCSALHCVVHRKFSLNIVEMFECDSERCKYTTDPDSSWQLSRWISARDVIANPRNILDVLSPRNEIMPCDQDKCKGKLHQTKILLNSPEIFTLCVGWDSVHSSPHEIQTFLEALPTEIKLDSCFRALAPQDSLQLAGVVCYYGMHYSLFLRHSAKDVWIYLDDSIVKQIGERWDEVKDKVIRAHQQPCMVVYVSPNASPIETSSAPKNVEVDIERLQKLKKEVEQENTQRFDHFNSQRRLEEEDRKYAQQLEEEERAIEETRRQEELFRQQQETERLRKEEEENRTQQLRNEQEAILLQIQKDHQKKLALAEQAKRDREIEIAQKELDLKARKVELEEIEANRKAKEELDRAERKRNDAQRNADRIEASRRRREEEDLRVRKVEEEARLRREERAKNLADETLRKHEETLLDASCSPSINDLIDVSNKFPNSASYTTHTNTTTTTPSSGQYLLDTSVWDDVTKSGNLKSSKSYGVSSNIQQPIRHPNLQQSTNQTTHQDLMQAAIQRVSATNQQATTQISSKIYSVQNSSKTLKSQALKRSDSSKSRKNYESSTASSRGKEKSSRDTNHTRQGSRDSNLSHDSGSDKERRKRSELNRTNTIGHTGNMNTGSMTPISTVTSGSGFTGMVKEPLMDRMFGKKTVGSGYMTEPTSVSSTTQKSTSSGTGVGLVRVEHLEPSRNYTSSKSYGSSTRINLDPSGLAAIPPAHSSHAHAGVHDRFERTSTPDSDGDRVPYDSSKYYESNDPIRASSRAPKSREYGQTQNDQEQDQLNRSRLQNSKRWRTPKNGSRDRPSNRQTPNEKTDLKEYLNREEPLYRETGSGSTGSHTTGSMSPPVSTYPYQPNNSPYDYQPNKRDDLIDMNSQNSCDNTGMHNIKQAMKDSYGKTSTGVTKFTKGMTKRFNNAGANLSRVGSNLISSNKKKNDNPIIHSTTTANLQSHQQNNLPLNLASSDSRRAKKY